METVQNAAKTSLSIRWVTAWVLVINVAIFIAAWFVHPLFFAGLFLALISALAYLWTPVRYVLSEDGLTVYFRVGSRRFEHVLRCEPIERSIVWSLRVFGNGGMFAGIGYFWNRMFGFFQAYVTSARHDDLVLVETDKRKIVISPRDARAFVTSWQMSNPAV